MSVSYFCEDPGLRDRVISALSPHADGCQDSDCPWCTDTFAQADAVIAVLAEYPPDVLQAHLREATGRGMASEPGS